MIEPGKTRFCGHFHQFVAIQVNETDVVGAELRLESALDEDQVCVSLMAWPLAHNNATRAKSQERLGGSAHENRVRIYFNARNVLDEVWLQQNGLVVKIQIEEANCSRQGISQVL